MRYRVTVKAGKSGSPAPYETVILVEKTNATVVSDAIDKAKKELMVEFFELDHCFEDWRTVTIEIFRYTPA